VVRAAEDGVQQQRLLGLGQRRGSTGLGPVT
jgi:hypothetical protein